MKRSLLSQTIHTLVSILLGQGSLIAAGIAISRAYGPVGKGIVSYAGITIMAVIVIGDGLAAAVARIAGDDPARAPAAYAAVRRIVVILSAILVPPIALIGVLVPSQHALIAVAAAVPFALYLQTMSAFHLLRLNVERSNFATLATNGATGLAELAAVASRHVDINGILAIWVVGYVAGAAIVARGIHGIGATATPPEIKQTFDELVRFGRLSSASSLATFLSVRIDVFIVSALLSPVALGNYTLALAVGELMWQVSRALSYSAYGRVAIATFAEGAAITARITRLVIALEIVSALIAFAFGPVLITLVYGAPFAAAGTALRFLLPGMMVYAADAILTYFLSVRANRPGLIVRIELVTLSICAIATLATVGRYGIIGPALATTFAYLFSFTMKAVMFARLTRTSAPDLLIVKRDDFSVLRRLRAADPVSAPVA